MEHIHTAVSCACFAALGLTLAEQIIPPEHFGKQIRLILAVLLMTAIISPLTKLDFSGLQTDLAFAEDTAAEITELAEQAQNAAVKESICAALNRALTANAVNCEVLDADVHIQADGSIFINEVTVSGNLLTGRVYLREWLGSSVEITEGGDVACMN